MKASIIIATYNHAEYLSDAIESAINQTIPCEVIVVNDGSTDNTLEVASKYPVWILNQKNHGVCNARNNGIKCSTGDWILCLDSDDRIAPDFIAKLIEKDDIVSCSQTDFGEYDKVWHPMEHPTYKDFLTGNRIHCCSLYKRKVWETIGGYDENMLKETGVQGYEDWIFWLSATKNGFTITTVQEPLFFYRKHGHSMVTDAIQNHDLLYKYILRNYGL